MHQNCVYKRKVALLFYRSFFSFKTKHMKMIILSSTESLNKWNVHILIIYSVYVKKHDLLKFGNDDLKVFYISMPHVHQSILASKRYFSKFLLFKSLFLTNVMGQCLTLHFLCYLSPSTSLVVYKVANLKKTL